MAYQSANVDFASKLNTVTTSFIKAIAKAKQMRDYITDYGGKDVLFAADKDGNPLNWNGVTGDELWAALDVFNEIDNLCKNNGYYQKLYMIVSPVID
jgi:hypothetical protein